MWRSTRHVCFGSFERADAFGPILWFRSLSLATLSGANADGAGIGVTRPPRLLQIGLLQIGLQQSERRRARVYGDRVPRRASRQRE